LANAEVAIEPSANTVTKANEVLVNVFIRIS
jgi:hypothetical protein